MLVYNLALVLVVLVTCVGATVALLALVFSMAPGWREERLLGLVCGSAALFSVFDVVSYLPSASLALRVTISGVSILTGALHIAVWILYCARQRGRSLSVLDRVMVLGLALLGAGGLVPGFYTGWQLATREVTWLGLSYHDPVPTLAGNIAFSVLALALLTNLVRVVQDHRRGVPRARISACVFAAITVGGLNDMLTSSGAYCAPNLLGLSFLGTLGLLGVSLTRRFMASARLLESLKRELESRVEERTQKLDLAQAALVRAERLGALGQLSAGVAHEINNPLSAILGNLQFLRRMLRKRPDFSEYSGAVEDSMVAIERIKRIVLRLLDASRAAAHDPVTNTSCRVATAMRGAVRVAESAREPHVKLELCVPDTLCARGDRYMLEQVLSNLLVNAYQAASDAKKPGRVQISAEQREDRVLITIKDDGSGMSAETRARLFEPFYTTKPLGKGTGLGLAVSAGLVQAMGGALTFESSEGRGTEARLSLHYAAEPSEEPASETVPTFRQRLLLVDDDDVVRRAAQRVLSRAFDVSVANGVQQALDSLAAHPVEIILCDVMMPDGGGEALYTKLCGLRPDLAERMLFLTGGVNATDAREFLANQPQPVLTKPVVLVNLLKAVSDLGVAPISFARSEPRQAAHR
jgi:signal transduction histidine kinase/ActR/RegA family two-component response regulator